MKKILMISLGITCWLAGSSAWSATPITYDVTSSSGDPATSGSLPYCVNQANDTTPNNPDIIRFMIPSANTITVCAPLVITDQVDIQGDGRSVGCHDGTGANPRNCFVFAAGSDGSTLTAVTIVDSDDGVRLESSHNRVYGCRIGVNSSDETRGNNYGIRIYYSSFNYIGGTTSGERNIISANKSDGVWILGGQQNKVQGNYIGTNNAGTGPLLIQDRGVSIYYSSANLIGGDTDLNQGNVLSGNDGRGIYMTGAAAFGNTICGNIIGLDYTGTSSVPNQYQGIWIDSDASGNYIGLPQSGCENVIATNPYNIWLTNSGVSRPNNNRIQNNYIGVDSSSNGFIIEGRGIYLQNADSNLIGGDHNNLEGNIISCQAGDYGYGVYVQGHGNTIAGNYIGTDAAGNTARANTYGVFVDTGSQSNLIGGANTAIMMKGNVLSGNYRNGILLKGSKNTVIQGNLIGTNAAGTARLDNLQIGLRVLNGSTGTMIGGNRSDGEGNVVSGNSSHGIEISNDDGSGGVGAASTGNTIAGNIIGLSLNQTARIFNSSSGLNIFGSPYNQIGLKAAGRGNVIAGNGVYNVIVENSNYTRVQNNRIGINESDQTSFTNNYGMLISQSSGCLIGGNRQDAAYERNIISGHGYGGRLAINCGVASALGNTIAGNIIGLDGAGNLSKPNAIGIYLSGPGNLIGGLNTGGSLSGNLISGNAEIGLDVRGSQNQVLGNYIGLDVTGTQARANGIGISLSGTASEYNSIGDGTDQGRNVISGNSQDGIKCSAGFGQRILNNYIGTSADGLQQINNQGYSIRLFGAGGCLIGREGAGNLICGRAGWPGIYAIYSESAGNTIEANWFNLLANQSLAPEVMEYPLLMELGPHDNSIGLKSTGKGNLFVGADCAISLYTSNTEHNGFFGNTICGFANTITAIGIGLYSGANQNKAAPDITSANGTLVSGTSEVDDYIQIFRANRIEGYTGGSLALVGTATADGSGDWSWAPAGLLYGDVITALASYDNNSTSQFSNNKLVIGLPTASPTSSVTMTVTPVFSSTPQATRTPSPTSTTTPTPHFVWNEKGVHAFPNPAKEQVTFILKLDQPAEMTVDLFNTNGERVATLKKKLEAGVGMLTWDCRQVAPGIYLAQVKVGNAEKKTIKIAVLQK